MKRIMALFLGALLLAGCSHGISENYLAEVVSSTSIGNGYEVTVSIDGELYSFFADCQYEGVLEVILEDGRIVAVREA